MCHRSRLDCYAQVSGLMVLERVAELRAEPRLALGAACAAVTVMLQLVVRWVMHTVDDSSPSPEAHVRSWRR